MERVQCGHATKHSEARVCMLGCDRWRRGAFNSASDPIWPSEWAHISQQEKETRVFICYIHCHLYFQMPLTIARGFPDGSDGKESVWNAGDMGLIPGSGRSYGEGNGNSLQYSCLENPTEEELGGLLAMGLQRAGHNWVTNTYNRNLCPSHAKWNIFSNDSRYLSYIGSILFVDQSKEIWLGVTLPGLGGDWLSVTYFEIAYY